LIDYTFKEIAFSNVKILEKILKLNLLLKNNDLIASSNREKEIFENTINELYEMKREKQKLRLVV
jgi:hypothetical protein